MVRDSINDTNIFSPQPTTNIAVKLPLFYLMDSVMKNVGGLYLDLFAAHIAVVYQRVFAEVRLLLIANVSF
jgi:hypothetical protein